MPLHILASRGKNVTDKNQCYGGNRNDSSAHIGWGPAYQYNCLHSGSAEHSGGNTIWYNYTIASAGTIIDENTTQENPASNINKATESICPKGWTLPSKAQIDTNRNAISFSPVLGGNYWDGNLENEDGRGTWWSSEAYDGAARHRLFYDGATLVTNNGYRINGAYIRCVQAS